MSDDRADERSSPPLPRLSGLALLSFVLGLLFFVPLVGVGAIVFGITALGGIDGSQGILHGRRLAIAGIVLGFVSILFICFTIPATLALLVYARASALEEAAVCRANLAQIGVAAKMYTSRTGLLPADLKTLVDKGFVGTIAERCPADRRRPPVLLRKPSPVVDYCYAAVRDASGPPQPVPIAWDKFLLHGPRSVNVLFTDGRTKFVSVVELKRLVEANAFRYATPPALPAPAPALTVEPRPSEPAARPQVRTRPAPRALFDVRLGSSAAARSIDTTAAELRLRARFDSTSALPAPRREEVLKKAIFTFLCRSTGKTFQVSEDELSDKSVHATYMVDYGTSTICRICGRRDACQCYYCPQCKRYYNYEPRHETALVITCPKGHKIPQEYH